MAKTTTIRVVNIAGIPQAGVQVIASDILGQWVTTDANGEISAQFEDDQVFCSLIAVKVADGAIYTSHLVMEAGNTQDITVPG